MNIHGGRLLVESLVAHDVQRAFCVAGESYLPVLDGFVDYPDIDVVTCRQEGGVTFMAEAYAQMSGQPGVALVTRGPGACNAAIGVHSAMQASTPMVLLVGLHAMADRDKEAFQEFDLPQMFGSLSKWAAVIDDVARIPDYIARAFHVAMSGRPGPVVLGLPEEILQAHIDAPETYPVIPSLPVGANEVQIGALCDVLSGVDRPLILVGGGGWSDEACADLAAFSSSAHIPVAASFRRQDVFDHRHGNYIGELGTGPNPDLVARVQEADVVCVLGARLNEITTQIYTLLQSDNEQKIIHVHPEAAEFGKACMPDLAIVSEMAPLCAALASGAHRLDGRRWAGWRDAARADYMAWSGFESGANSSWQGADMTQIFAYLQEALPKDSIVTTDAGNFSGWAQRYLRYGRPGRLLAPISGAMGYSVPAAVEASMEYPERVVVGMCGDGGFLMNGQELATAMRYGAAPIILVFNNSRYGTIAMHQEKDFPGRVSATDLTNPDFVTMAQSYGGYGSRVEGAAAFPEAFEAARSAGTLAVIEVVQDPAQVTTRS